MMSRTPSTARKRLELGERRRTWLVRKDRLAQAAVAEMVHLDRWDLLVLLAKMASRVRKARPASLVSKARKELLGHRD